MKEKIHLISRLRKDAVGWDEPPPYSGRGRPRKRGKKWKLTKLPSAVANSAVTVEIYGKVHQLAFVVRDVTLRNVADKVRVVVIEKETEPIILLSTDLSLSAEQIIEMYAVRFKLELGIRDLKQYFGLGDYQCYKFQSILRFVNLCCLSFCIWRMVLLESEKLSWFSEDDSSGKVTESSLSFRRLRRHVRRLVIKRFIFSKSAPDRE